MIIDMHTHIRNGWETDEGLDRLESIAARFGISRVITSMGAGWQHEPTEVQVREANDFVLDIAGRRPSFVSAYCYLNPCHAPAFSIEELARCIAAGCVGIKLWVACEAHRPELDPIAEAAAQHNIPILQHAWKKTTGNYAHESLPEHIAELARRHPRTSFIMAHLGGIWQWGIKAVRALPNVSTDCSGGSPEQGGVAMALRELGPQRVLFGSDITGRGFASQIAKIDALRIPQRTRTLILAGNARRIFRLPK
jgi:hypothetical protein